MINTVLKRDIFDQIEKYLGTENIIVLHGSRQVGKSHILYYLDAYLKGKGETSKYIDLEDSRSLDVLEHGVDAFLTYLKGEGYDFNTFISTHRKLYVLIDEIQYLTTPSPFLKLLIDHHTYIQLVVSGSSSFSIKSKFSDSLVGRTVNFEIYPLTFKEFLRFKSIVYTPKQNKSPLHIEKLQVLYREFMAFGGYPKIVLEDSIERKEKYLLQIVDTYIRKDISDLAKIHDIPKFNNLLKIIASQSGQLLNIAQLANTCNLSSNTVKHYLFILENTYIIKLVSPFSLSPKVEVAKTPKIFFFDTGLLQMLWLKKLQTENVGNVFETSVYAELIKSHGVSNINFWRNKNQNEIDFILQTKDGIVPVEAKYNFNQFKISKINPFIQKYKVGSYKVVGLFGDKESARYVFPWELV